MTRARGLFSSRRRYTSTHTRGRLSHAIEQIRSSRARTRYTGERQIFVVRVQGTTHVSLSSLPPFSLPHSAIDTRPPVRARAIASRRLSPVHCERILFRSLALSLPLSISLSLLCQCICTVRTYLVLVVNDFRSLVSLAFQRIALYVCGVFIFISSGYSFN